MQDRQPRWAWTHRYAVPMFVASLISVVLAGGGLVGVMAFTGGSAGNGGGEPDACAPGTWQMVGYTESGELGEARMVGGDPTFTFRDDGTGVADFGNATEMEVDTFQGTASAELAGQITYRYETSDQSLEFVDQDSQTTMSSELDPFGIGELTEFTLPTEPLDYTCDGSAMTIAGDGRTFELQRTGS